MNFRDDPSDYFYQEKNLNSNRQLNGVYKDLSNTCCFTSIITAGLWRLFGNHISFDDSKKTQIGPQKNIIIVIITTTLLNINSL